jgi:hypothetical protein
MPYQKDVQEKQWWWCPKWYWPFAVCSGYRTVHKWCYNFSWVKSTAYAVVIHYEACEAGKLYTWNEGGIGLGTLDTVVPNGETCFDSARDSDGVCDGSNTGLEASPLTAEEKQADWRYCVRCHAMFYDGYSDKGVCPKIDLKIGSTTADLLKEGRDLISIAGASTTLHVRIFDSDGKMVFDKSESELIHGNSLPNLKDKLAGVSDYAQLSKSDRLTIIHDIASIVSEPALGHSAEGYNFSLPHGVPESQWAQKDWRYCQDCHVMFYDGYPDKGVCASGGAHRASGFHFVLPHDIPFSGQSQKNWRYCEKCHSLFFDGYAQKGICPAAGGHHAAGLNFVLTYGS